MEESYINEEGLLYVGDIRIMDARQNVRDEIPDVVDQVRILRISDPIPNDTMSFGPEFPEELRTQIFEALLAFSETEEWESSALGSPDGYDWTGLAPIEDSVFDSVRTQFAILGFDRSRHLWRRIAHFNRFGTR